MKTETQHATVIIDEPQTVRDHSAQKTRERIRRYVVEHPKTTMCEASGTSANKSLADIVQRSKLWDI